MSLLEGTGDAIIKSNTKALLEAGYPVKQAQVIAYKKAGRGRETKYGNLQQLQPKEEAKEES